MSQPTSTGANTRNGAFLAALMAAVLVIAGVFIFTRGDDNADGTPNDGSTEGIGEGAPDDRTDCTQVRVGSSPEKAAVLAEIAAAYNAENRQVDGNCTWIEVTRLSSGTGATALARGWNDEVDGPRPDVWSPSSSAWPEVASEAALGQDQPDIFPTGSESIAQSPLVIGMPRPMAEALGWPDKAIGWSDLVKLAEDDEGWGAYGHPEWGDFRLGKTNPKISTSGLNATVATFFAATGVSSDLTVAQVQDPANAEFVRKVESTVVHYGDTTLTFLQNLLDADLSGRGLTYISAVTVEEKSILDYNSGNPSATADAELTPPKTPLVAIYPKEGTLISDSPWVILEGDWVDNEKKAVAQDMLDFVLEADNQQKLSDAGFRTGAGEVGPQATLENGLIADQPTAVLGTPSGSVLQAVIESWDENRKPARVLMIVDVSGSMAAPAGDEGATRLELAQDATESALDQLAPQDDLGLWIFSSENIQGNEPYRELVPVAPLATSLPKVKQSVAGLQAEGGTGLYATIKAAFNDMTADADPKAINGIVVLSDGRNEHQDNDLQAVLDLLDTEDASTGIRVFTVGYSEGADQEVLQQIAAASRAKSYDASNPATIEKVMTDVLSNF